MKARRVLVVQHQDSCPAAWFGDWLTEAGLELDIATPYREAPLPALAHAALVVLGGSMGAHDDDVAWLGPTKDLIREAAASGIPTLGICLGHQLAAAALGGRVAPSPHGQTMGLQRIVWQDDAHRDPVFGEVARLHPDAVAAQWNDDIVIQNPSDTVPLATNARGDLLAARFADTVWGVQWHPEASAAIVSAWAEKDRERACRRGDDVDAAVRGIREAEPELHRTWRTLAKSFARQVGG